ncbi:hypothetical protein PISMIDRAFT_676582 [Pisolithus microcarpus 441]|uniref:Uncharacterized protein n=1 Tax=Pisolithus microcarpus 441 TaxID=765257 RepID=A0A0C9ZV19_9AGAM|nr:hypothetical protein PISMIDRAFT_676582 [Pisolithus microcarpus 441]
MSDGEDEDEEADGQGKRPVLMFSREEEGTRLAPTICVEDMGSMGDVEDEGGQEGQCTPNSHLFVSDPVQPRPNDDRHTRGRPSLSPARSAPIFSSGSTSAGSSSLPATSPLTSAMSSSTSDVSPAATDITEAVTSRGRKRRSTIESWFPLCSFIDLKADSDERIVSSWKWRSFIEIGVASL